MTHMCEICEILWKLDYKRTHKHIKATKYRSLSYETEKQKQKKQKGKKSIY